MHEDANGSTLQAQRLTELIGTEASGKLLERYGGETVYLPNCKRLAQVRRQNEILRLRAEGARYSEIVRRLGVSMRAAQTIVARGWAHDPADYELFMPTSFCELAECIGAEKAETLCAALGGFYWTFPEWQAMEERDNEFEEV